MASSSISDHILDQAYDLALFIVPDETAAEQIVREALTKLDVTADAQHKRSYYRPRSGVARTKVALSPLHLLQRLIYIESEKFERSREANEASNRDFIVSFLKHLVRCALKRNSFYAAIAISRILHNYTTAECMDIYNLLIQDPDQYKEENYYRSRKAVLMDEVEERFADRVQLSKGIRSEERFETQPTTEELVRLVRAALSRLTPWETKCLLPSRFDPLSEELEMFKDSSGAPGVAEMQRFHALVHPECLGGIARNLRLDDTRLRLEVPRFIGTKDVTMIEQSRKKKGSYNSSAIRSGVHAASEYRRGVSPHQLNVWVDGTLAGVLHLDEQPEVALKLRESAEIVEVRTTKEEGDILLAVHLLNSTVPQQVEMDLPKGKILSFNTLPEADGTLCEVRLETSSLVRWFAMPWLEWHGSEPSNRGLQIAWRIVLPAAFAMGTFLLLWNYPNREASKSLLVARNSTPVAIQPANPVSEIAHNRVSRSPNREEASAAVPVTRSMDAAPRRELKSAGKIALDLPPETVPPSASFPGITITKDKNEAEALLRVRLDDNGQRLVSELRDESGRLLWSNSISCKATESGSQSDCRIPAARARALEVLLRRLAEAVGNAQH